MEIDNFAKMLKDVHVTRIYTIVEKDGTKLYEVIFSVSSMSRSLIISCSCFGLK